jgi:hypothetical protein
MLSKQEEDRERLETLRNDQRVLGIVAQERELTEEQKAALEKKIDDASTYMAHSNEEIPGRFAAQNKAQVTGKSASDGLPKMQGYWAEADMGLGPTFGKQLHTFDGGSMTAVQEKKR